MQTASLDRTMRRLLPRHTIEPGPQVEWNLASVRTGWRRFSRVPRSSGSMVDVSLEGALIEVPCDQIHDIGDRVAIRLHDIEGVVVIRHRRLGYDGYYLYGVTAAPRTPLAAEFIREVDRARGDDSKLLAYWRRAH